MKYHLFKKLAALGMAASVSLSAITPAFAANDSSEEFVAEAENPDSDTETETPPDDEQAPSNEDTTPVDGDNEDSSNKDDGEQAPPSNEETSSKDEGEQTSPPNENNSKDEQTPSNEDTSNDEQTTPNEDTSNDEQTTSNENISNDEQAPPSNEDTSNDGEQPPSNEDTSNDEQMPSNENTSNDEQTPSNENLSKDDQTPSNENTSNDEQTPPSNENTLEEEKTSETPTVKPDGYGEVTQAGGKGDSLVTLEIVNDGSSNPGGGDNKDPDNPGGGGDNKDPDNPGGGDDNKDPDNPGGGGDNKDPEPMIFSAYVPSKLPMKLTQDGTVLTPSNAAIINGVATKGIAVKDIEAHLDYDWAPEDWDADYASMPTNTKNVGLKLRGDTLSKDGDFSVNAEDWKIPKDSYIDLNMEAKLPPQKIETATQNSDVAVLSFTLDWSGDDTTTGPKWEGGTINPDKPDDTSSKPKIESTDTIIKGGTGSIKVTWDAKGDTVTLTSVTSSNTDVASIGDSTGSNGNKTVTLNGLKSGTSTITATLSNGETATLEVTVYEVGNPDDIKVTVSNKDFNVGDSITSDDVTASVPLVAPDGSTKTITVKPSVDTNTLQAGNNSLTGIVTVGGQDYPIHFDVTVENPEEEPAIKAESNDIIVNGSTGTVKFTWDTKGNTVTLKNVKFDNSSIGVASLGNVTGEEGSKIATVTGLSAGKANLVATFSNGQTATYVVDVHRVGNAEEIQVTVNNKELGVGDKVTPNDVTVKVPVISSDGDKKFIEVTPSIEDKALIAGSNTLTGTVTVGGQNYPIHFDVTIEGQDSNKSGIQAESNDTLIAGETGNVVFTWDTKDNSTTLTGVTSSNESIATVGTITGVDGEKTVTIHALKGGTATITATLDNGETATFEAKVYTVGDAKDIQITVNNQDLGIGDKVTSNDITVKVPIISPDGETKFIERTPSIKDNTLQAGDNTITGTVTVGKATYNITVTLTIEQTSIPISVTSTTYIVGNESNPINFKWDTKDGSITLSNVTSSNAEVATIKTTAGDEGNKTVDLDCLKAGTTNIELTFSNGSTASCEITVYEVGNLDDAEVVIADKEFNAGDTLSSDDVTIKVPLVDGEGNIKMVDMSVNFEDTTLKPGTNNFTVNLAIGGQTHPIHFEVTTPEQNDNLSMTLAEAQDLGFTFRDYEDGLEVVSFSNPRNVNTIEVPGLVEGKEVLSLGDFSFSKSSKNNLNVEDTVLREVILPDTIEKIGQHAFDQCRKLNSINIPDNVTSIGYWAFAKCNLLTAIDLPEGLTTIGDYTFYNCVCLTSITIPKSVTSIEMHAFERCSRLTSVTIQDGLTKIGYRAFKNSDLKDIIIPESLTSLDETAFDSCQSLESIYVNKPKYSISGARWSAPYATVYWKGEFDESILPGSQTSNKSNIKAESNDTLVAGGTGNVAFTWDTRGNTISLTSVTSSNTDVVSIGTTTGSEGSKTTVLNALKGGTSTITATLSNGETATFEATVYEMGNPDDIQTTVNNKDLSAGDKVTPNDVTVKVPLTAPDGSTKLLEVTPSIEDKALEAGDNTLTGTVTVGGKDYPISFDVTAEIPDDMKSGLKAEANDLLVAGGSGNVNFKWDTKGDTVTLNKVTSSNQNVASVGAISGTEGNKTAAVNGLQSGVSTITATLSNGEKASIDVPIHTVDTEKEMQVEVADKEFTEGDTLNSEDVTVKVPLTAPDGSNKYMPVHPTIADTELEAGENTVEGTVAVGGMNLNVTITVNVKGDTTTNPSDGLVMSVAEAQANGFTFGIYKEGVEITGFKNVNFKSTINVPAQIGDFMVLKVGDNVFQNQTNLKEITLPNSVTEIGNSTFAGCSNLAKFDTNKVTDIGTNAFANCTKMKTLTLPKCATIGRSVFDGCTSLTELNTNRVSEIGYGAFANCTGLTKVTFGNKLSTIGEKAFADCTGLTEIDTNNVVSIGANAFDSCDGLETLVLGENLTSIGSNAFNYCDSLTDVEINNPNTTLGTDVFSNCDVSLLVPLEVVNTKVFAGQGQQGVSELHMKIVQETKLADNALEQCRFANIVLPNGTTAIGNYAFANSKLKSITIPNGVTSIGSSAFINSASLPSVTFPNTLTSLGADSFKACTSFKEITLPNSLTEVGANTFADCTNLVTANLQSNAASVSAGEFSNCTSLTTVTNLPTVQDIGASAFYKCGALSDIGSAGSLSNVQSIGANAFTDCSSLTELGGLNSLVTVGDRAFLNCTGILKLENVNKVQTIGNSVFENCTAIAEVGALDALTSVGNSAFKNCSKVPSIKNVSNLETIGDSAFENCTALAELGDIPKVTSIGVKAFSACTALTSISDAPALTSIGDNAFYGCTNLTQVGNVPVLVSIGNNAFMNCTTLTGIGEAPSITSIGSSAFKNCSALAAFIVPEGVTVIKGNTFENCTSLPEITMNTVTSIGNSAFSGCTALTKALYTKANSVGECAFYNCSNLSATSNHIPTSIGAYAYANCKSLGGISLNSNLSSLGVCAFMGCTGATGSVRIPNGIKVVPSSAFEGCTGITSVNLHSGITRIGASAFEGCSSLTTAYNLQLASKLDAIEEKAFYNCTSLKTANFHIDCLIHTQYTGDNIGSYAFANTALESVKFPCRSLVVSDRAYYGCKSLKSLTIYGYSDTTISSNAFSNCPNLKTITINGPNTLVKNVPFGATNATVSRPGDLTRK